jgi:hypothetical protein
MFSEYDCVARGNIFLTSDVIIQLANYFQKPEIYRAPVSGYTQTRVRVQRVSHYHGRADNNGGYYKACPEYD